MPYGTGLAKGMALTFKKMFARPLTIQYPTERMELFERTRHELNLTRWEDGSLKCVACKLCARACPDCLIDIDTTKQEDGSQTIDGWRWESQACMFCGLCAEACPWDALELTDHYELASFTMAALWRSLADGEIADTIQHHRSLKKASDGDDEGGDES